jgi:hypothetical protein
MLLLNTRAFSGPAAALKGYVKSTTATSYFQRFWQNGTGKNPIKVEIGKAM